MKRSLWTAVLVATLFAPWLATADSISVANPSFQADNFTVFPGYRGGANPTAITGWGATGGSGINGTDLGAGTPFADNGALPDGTRVAFIQGAGSLTQTLSGFEVGRKYWVQVWMNARNCCGDFPKISVSLGGQSLLSPQPLSPVGGANPYSLASFVWTAGAPSALLSLGSQAGAGGDASATFDAVAVIKRGADEVLIANPSFEASGQGMASPGYYPNIAGWTKVGEGQTGLNTSAGPLQDNGLVPDGKNVLFLQQTVGLQQSVLGLTPGRMYRLNLRYNSRAATSVPRFRVTIDGQTALDTNVPPVGAGQPYRTLTFDFTAANETASLLLENMGVGTDSTVLVDNISLAALSSSLPPTPTLPSPGDPGGAGGIVTFNEIHYHPGGISAPEWIELVNQNSVRVDLSGWRIKAGLAFTFPVGTVMEPGAYLVVSGNAGHPSGALGPFIGALNNAGDTLKLVTRQDWLIDEMSYGVADEWPAAADGAGRTLAKRAVYFASNVAASWTASAETNGTPGGVNFATVPTLPTPAPHIAGPVVINEIFYHAHPTYADPSNATAYAEIPTEWVELHNRTDAPVDLSGWRLDDAISYRFPANTSLAAGGFIVVDQRQFSGSLANRGDSIKLRDTTGALADKVRYRSAGRWSEYADGAGASLELIDPRSDNTKPESWAASDESAKMPWRTYSYRALGAEPPGSNNPNTWREFLLGLLDAGEVLLDDLSVREDPDGANVAVIQNGTFEGDTIGQPPARWRCLGTHKRSVVVADPDGPGKVLKVVATGSIEHTYNNCSTTLAGNRAIDPTKTYQISFRAKWLAGSPQLNTRLYLVRAARTTILPQPAVAGTPGAVNSRRVPNAGPTYAEFVHAPLVPALGQPVTVVARAEDPDGVAGLTLFYSVNGGPWQSTRMTLDADGRHAGAIPGQPFTGMTVQFFLQGADALGATSAFPAAGTNSRALYRIGDGGVASQPVANKIRLLMTAADAAFMHAPIHSVSDARFGATLVVNDREAFYGVAVRLRSSPYGRQGARTGWNINLDPEQPFRGTETGLVLDGAFNMPRGDGGGWIETTLGASINELLYQRIAEHAGGLAAEHDDVVYLATPYYENRRAQLRLRRYSNAALDDFTPDGGNGSLFKQEIIYYPTTTVDGNPESLKNPYSTFTAVDIGSQGPSKDAYRFNYLPRNHADRDDFSGIIAMGAAFSQPTTKLYAASAAALDLESWSRTLAMNALIGLADTYNQSLPHNIQFLARPGDGRVLLLPWDMDHSFYFASNFSIYGGDAHRVKDLIADPRMKRRLAGHLLDLCQTTFHNAYLDPWIDHYNAVAGKTYNANFKSWVGGRRAFVLARLTADWPTNAFSITNNGGADFAISAPTTTLRGKAWINVHAIRRAGTAEPLGLTWINGSTWEAAVPLGPGANPFQLEALNYQGLVIGADTITITNIGLLVAASATNLAVSEIMYHPANPTPEEAAAGFTTADDFEFIELMNVGTNVVVLTGAAFTDGIAFTFTNGTLAAGARLLLVKNSAAFAQRHGVLWSSPVFGTYTGSLNNAGEHLLLLDRSGLPILDFNYGDNAPWPAEADGDGYSLTLVRPQTFPNPALAASWRVSREPGGSPGTNDTRRLEDYPTLLDYALAGPPTVVLEAGYPVFSWRERLGADDATITPELSSNLAVWIPDPGNGTILVLLDATVNADGTRTVRYRTALPAGASPQTFLRLRVQSR